MNTNWLVARIMLLIWNPEIWTLCSNPWMRRRQKLLYRARGIVLHDRALNGEVAEHETEEVK